MSRKAARDNAFKIIYQVPFHEENDVSITVENYWQNEEDKKLTEGDMDYISLCVKGCFDNVSEIDAKISASLKNWTIDRISKVNLAILRLSVSEMSYADVPYQVSINEAVELAKKYSDDEAPSFINGVLADIQKLR